MNEQSSGDTPHKAIQKKQKKRKENVANLCEGVRSLINSEKGFIQGGADFAPTHAIERQRTSYMYTTDHTLLTTTARRGLGDRHPFRPGRNVRPSRYVRPSRPGRHVKHPLLHIVRVVVSVEVEGHAEASVALLELVGDAVSLKVGSGPV
jgi:hypothetical protein